MSIPDTADESFYDGKVTVILKDAVFQVRFIGIELSLEMNRFTFSHSCLTDYSLYLFI